MTFVSFGLFHLHSIALSDARAAFLHTVPGGPSLGLLGTNDYVVHPSTFRLPIGRARLDHSCPRTTNDELNYVLGSRFSEQSSNATKWRGVFNRHGCTPAASPAAMVFTHLGQRLFQAFPRDGVRPLST